MLAAVVAAAAAAVANNCPNCYDLEFVDVGNSALSFTQCTSNDFECTGDLDGTLKMYDLDDYNAIDENLLCTPATETHQCCYFSLSKEAEGAALGFINCYQDFPTSVYVFGEMEKVGVTCSSVVSKGDDSLNYYAAVRCPATDSTDAPTGDTTDATDATDPTDATDAPATDAPPPPSPSPGPGGDDSNSGMSTGEIVGISFGAVVGVVLAGTAIAAA